MSLGKGGGLSQLKNAVKLGPKLIYTQLDPFSACVTKTEQACNKHSTKTKNGLERPPRTGAIANQCTALSVPAVLSSPLCPVLVGNASYQRSHSVVPLCNK